MWKIKKKKKFHFQNFSLDLTGDCVRIKVPGLLDDVENAWCDGLQPIRQPRAQMDPFLRVLAFVVRVSKLQEGLLVVIHADSRAVKIIKVNFLLLFVISLTFLRFLNTRGSLPLPLLLLLEIARVNDEQSCKAGQSGIPAPLMASRFDIP